MATTMTCDLCGSAEVERASHCYGQKYSRITFSLEIGDDENKGRSSCPWAERGDWCARCRTLVMREVHLCEQQLIGARGRIKAKIAEEDMDDDEVAADIAERQQEFK